MQKNNPVFLIYLWLIAAPVLLVATVLVALSTIILSPLLPNSQLSYHPARIWARLICYLTFVRVHYHGFEKLNPKQSYVFVLNHQSAYDIFVVYGGWPCIFKWMMKAELRKIPLVGKACEAAGHIFIDRSSPVAARYSLDKAEAQLSNGISLVVFPEGTRTYDGTMLPFKKGAFRVAADLGLPVVPVTLKGSFERLHRNSLRVHPGVIDVFVHDPVDVKMFLPDKVQDLIQTTFDRIQDGLLVN